MLFLREDHEIFRIDGFFGGGGPRPIFVVGRVHEFVEVSQENKSCLVLANPSRILVDSKTSISFFCF